MDYKNLILKKEDGFATIILNRPDKLNALNAELTSEIVRASSGVGQDEEIKALIITGAGRGFCSGADLSSDDFKITSLSAGLLLMQQATALIMGIREMPKPVIAAVNGPAVGGGCNLALACDIIIASEKAKFIEPYISLSAHPDFGAIYFLPRLVGQAKANELLFSGRTVDADEADRIGLVSRVVTADRLDNETREIARKIAKSSPLVVRLMKSSIIQAQTMDLPKALACEATAQSMVFTTEDFKEAMTAFVEKREPIFKGK